MTAPQEYVPLVVVTRGQHRESTHYGALAIVRPDGRALAACGDPGLATYLRSTAKPFQALPFLETGAAEAIGADDEELALLCASHGGTEDHLKVVARLQDKAGIGQAELACGSHMPYDTAAAARLRQSDQSPQANHHNCSGKHSGMLATARHLGEPLAGYLRTDHPVQRRILTVLAEVTSMEEGLIGVGTDGCSAPNFRLPLVNAATAFARLADSAGLELARRQSIDRIWRAMTGHPQLVSGEGRLDDLLMGALPGRLLTKEGAEGFLGMALRPSPGEPGLGVAIKIADGDAAQRALPVVAATVLRELGWLDDAQAADIVAQAVRPVTSHAGEIVGAVRPVLKLDWQDGR